MCVMNFGPERSLSLGIGKTGFAATHTMIRNNAMLYAEHIF